jgi:uncharacterized membrane protein
MRKLVLIIAAVTLMASASAAVAEEAYPQPVQVVAAVLQLSEQQVGSLMEMLRLREQAVQPLQQQLRTRQEALGQALQGATPDPQTVGQLLIETRTIEQQIATVSAQAAAQFQQVLDQEQLERLQQIQATAGVCQILPAFQATGLL